MKKFIAAIFASACLLLVILFLCACGGSASDDNGSGGGSGNGEEAVSSAEDLYTLNKSNKNFKLTADINLNGGEWVPISSFSGTLDGNGHKISNFTVNGSNGNFGFFNTLGGTVKNLTIEGASVTATGMTGYAGVLCGQSDGATIENVTVSGTVTARLMTNVAGICGYSANASVISNCKNYADVTGFINVGGISGYITRKNISTSNGYFENNENYGNIEALGNTNGGGIFGHAQFATQSYNKGNNWNFTLQNFKNFGSVTVAGQCAGGIVGKYSATRATYSDTYVDLSFTNCENKGNISGTSTFIGGIIGNSGYVSNVLMCKNSGNITSSDCYAGGIAGSINVNKIQYCENTGSVTGKAYVGGIMGWSNNIITLCKNSGTITGTGSSNAKTSINESNVTLVGGIVGLTSRYASDCANSGEIVSTGGQNCVGGIAGAMRPKQGDVIENNENSGNITVNSGDMVGGIVGKLQAYRPSVNHGQYTFSGTNSGNITAENSFDVGGIVGYASCITDWSYQERCYAVVINSTNSGNITGRIKVAGIIGCIWNYAETDEIYWSTNSNTGTISAPGDYDELYCVS